MSKSRHSRITAGDEPRPRRQPKPTSARAEIDQQLDELADLLAPAGSVPGMTPQPVLVYSSGNARIRHYDAGPAAVAQNALTRAR